MQPGPKKQVFLADDDSDDQFLFEEALGEIHCGPAYSLSVASDGVQLMSLLNAAPTLPEVIFLDLNMPRKNGFDCLKEIRSSASYESLPVVMLSTTQDEHAVEKAFTLGANRYMRKPTSYDDFKKLLDACLCKGWAGRSKPAREAFLYSV